jgi:hypothetical protein
MSDDRAEMMGKARAKHGRRQKKRSTNKASRASKRGSTNAAATLTEKVVEAAKDAAHHVGMFVKDAATTVKDAATTVTGRRDDKAGRASTKRPKRRSTAK